MSDSKYNGLAVMMNEIGFIRNDKIYDEQGIESWGILLRNSQMSPFPFIFFFDEKSQINHWFTDCLFKLNHKDFEATECSIIEMLTHLRAMEGYK